MADVEIRVETDGGNQALPPKRPTIIRPPSVHQSTGDRHGPSVPGRPVLPPPGGRPLPPVPGQKSNLSGEDHSNGQAIHQTKPQSTADSRSNKAKGSVRKRPEITILSARPMSEVGFRDGKMDHSPVSTPSPIIVEHLGGDGTAGGHLPPDQPHPVPARPKSPLPSRPKSPVPSHPKMPIPSRPKSFVSNENTKGVESGQSSVEEKPRVKIEVTEEQRPKRPTIIRAAPKPPSIDSVSNQLQVSSNSTEAGLISSVVVPKPRPRPRSMKISSDPDMKPEAFEQFDSDDEESLAESKRSPKEAPPPRPLPSPKMLQKKDLNAQDSKLSPRSEQPPPRPPPSPKLSIRRKDTNSKHSPGSEETGNETSKMAEPPPRPPPSPKMSMRRKPEDSTSDGSSNASKPKPKPKPKPVVLPKPKLAVKPVMSQKKEIVEDDTNQLCEWDIIEDNAIKPARAPPKPPRTKSFDSQMSDDASPLSSDITPSPRNEDNRLANKDSNEDNRSNRPRPPLPKRRSIATAQSSEGDPSEKLRENETRQREVIEQPCLTNKSADTVSEHIRRSSLAPHKERPPLPKRHSLDVSSMSTNKPKPNLLKSNSIVDDEFLPSDDTKSEDSTRKLPGAKQVLPTNITCDIQRAVNSHKEGMRKSDQTSEKPSSKWKQIVVNMNEEKRRAPPLPKRKNPPKCDSFIEKDADSKLSPETMPHSINFNEQPSDRDSVTDSLNESNKSSQSLSKPVAPVSRPPLPSKAPSKKKSDNPVQSSTDGGNIHSRDENSVQPLVQISPEGENEEKVSLRSKPNRPTGGPSRPMSMPLKSLNTGKLSGSEEKRVKGDKPHPPQPQHSKADSLGAPVLPQRPGPGHPLYHYLVEGPRGVALFDYGSDQPDELTFKSGDTILLLRRIDHAWLMGKIGKKQGIFPQNFIDILEPLPDADEQMPSEDIVGSHSPVVKQDLFGHGPRCQARFDFDSDGADDLTFEEGDVIRIIDHIGEDWLKGEFSGKTGIFPLSFVEIIEDLPFEAVQQKTDQTVTHNNNINVVSAVSDFEGHENELTFQKGAKITVLSQVGKEWLFGELNGQQGLFPSNFVDSVPPGLPEYQLPETETQSPTAVTDSPHCIALFDYLGQTQEDLQFETGQKIELLEHVGTDWLRGRINDREGMFPSSFVQIERDVIPEQKAVKFGRALFDFLGQNESELTFKAGAMICLQELLDGDGNWRWGELDGRRGIFPSNFVEEQ